LKILITGKDGQLGWELQRSLAGLGDIVATGRQELDLSDPTGIRQLVRSIRPDVVLNTAAYNAVDRAESEPDIAFKVNAVAPGLLAEECRDLGALLIHFSTDYVFDGKKTTPYSEEDEPAPLSVYGRSKLAGEQAVRAAKGRALSFRTAWLYSHRRDNFVATMWRLARQKSELRVVNDQTGTPTWVKPLSDAMQKICKLALSRRGGMLGEGAPIYHATCLGETTRYEFVRAIFEDLARKAPNEPIARLMPIPSADYPSPASRPKYSALSNAKLERDFGIRLPDWQSAFIQFAQATRAR
jgi:dTDP-4-dehydrorhamnose reductase